MSENQRFFGVTPGQNHFELSSLNYAGGVHRAENDCHVLTPAFCVVDVGGCASDAGDHRRDPVFSNELLCLNISRPRRLIQLNKAIEIASRTLGENTLQIPNDRIMIIEKTKLIPKPTAHMNLINRKSVLSLSSILGCACLTHPAIRTGRQTPIVVAPSRNSVITTSAKCLKSPPLSITTAIFSISRPAGKPGDRRME